MERLTRKIGSRYGLVEGYTVNTLAGARAVVDRLAAYEDTGLEPEEIREIIDDKVAEVAKTLRRMIQSGEMEHLKELLDAEQEGRLVVLPCKVGQRVWVNGILSVGRCEEHEITSVSVYIGAKTDIWFNAEMVEYRGEARCSFGLDQIGKTVFLTREEAERALEGGATNA